MTSLWHLDNYGDLSHVTYIAMASPPVRTRLTRRGTKPPRLPKIIPHKVRTNDQTLVGHSVSPIGEEDR